MKTKIIGSILGLSMAIIPLVSKADVLMITVGSGNPIYTFASSTEATTTDESFGWECWWGNTGFYAGDGMRPIAPKPYFFSPIIEPDCSFGG